MIFSQDYLQRKLNDNGEDNSHFILFLRKNINNRILDYLSVILIDGNIIDSQCFHEKK